jgi:SAM-dependent methyltransferase
MYKSLMLASGRSEPKRQIKVMGPTPEWTTLDIDPDVNPDLTFDLNDLSQGRHLPFGREAFDEIHIYQTLHMYGKQGDAKGWFREFNEYWRVLAPDGIFCSICPAINGEWAWADPGCTRMIHPVNIKYLTKAFYELPDIPRTESYRNLVKGWWRIMLDRTHNGSFMFVLRKETE